MGTKDDLLRALKKRGFSESIINAFSKIPREKFIPSNLESRAYEDLPLPIGLNQTISQPSTIAIMLQFLDLKEEKQKILEIGSGCGYVLALISKISPKSEIYGVERLKELAETSKINLANYSNVKVYNKDGSRGFKEHSPYDRIIISAECERDTVENLSNQLKIDGKIVAPILQEKNYYYADMSVFEKTKNGLIKLKESISGFMFVPLIKNEED